MLAEKSPGLRSVRRPASVNGPEFDLAYCRVGPRGRVPVVVLPGGPGLASTLPYQGFRTRAAKSGVDTIMIEHRGIGLSRRDTAGDPLPPAAITIRAVVDDIAAVLNAEGIAEAVIYGSSYGTYLASGFGIVHPDRVAGMVLDSVMLSAHDHHVVREHTRRLLWDGDVPELQGCARLLREVVACGADQDQACDVARIVYEFGGRKLLNRILTQALAGRANRTWKSIAQLGRSEIDDEIAAPYVMEFEPVGPIAFTELNYAPPPDGGPFDPAPQFAATARKYPAFAGEPFDIPSLMPQFDWPVALIVGSRDLRTPRPIAERAASVLPHAQVVQIDNGHSALDTHQLAALHVLTRMASGDHELLNTAQDRAVVDALPVRGAAGRFLSRIISVKLIADKAVSFPRTLIKRIRHAARWS